MRKDSELLLRKALQYKDKTGEVSFELDLSYFSEIPNVEVEIEDIFAELKSKQCISKKSTIFENTIKIHLTLDGITYFDNEDKEKPQGNIIYINGEQINIATDNGKITAKQFYNKMDEPKRKALKTNIPKTIMVEENNYKGSTKSSHSGNEILWMGILIVVVLTRHYINYHHQIQLGLVVASIVTEIITCLVYYYSKKAKVFYGKNIKEISYFNMSSILGVPILILFINSPVYTSKIKFDLFVQMADNNGILSAFLNSEYGYYALFQMAGMFLVAMFLVHIISSNIYIIAVTNIAAGSREMWIWNSLFRRTYKRGKSWKQHVKVGVLFLIFSILFATGIFAYVIIKLSNCNFGVY